MPKIDTFTLVTGLASLFGFIIQVFDLMPRFRRAREQILLLLVGVFIGSVVRAFDPSGIRVNFALGSTSILVGVAVVVCVAALGAAAFAGNKLRRAEFYGVASVSAIIVCVVAFFGAIMSEGPRNMERERLTVYELTSLARMSEQAQDYERAAAFLRSAQGRLQASSDALPALRARISDLEKAAVRPHDGVNPTRTSTMVVPP